MSANTKIEWATKTWNPLRGCSKVSEGCRNCYAIRQAHRFSGPGQPYEGLTKKGAEGLNWTGDIRLVPEALAAHNAHHNQEKGRDTQGRFMSAGRVLDGRTWDEYPEATAQ